MYGRLQVITYLLPRLQPSTLRPVAQSIVDGLEATLQPQQHPGSMTGRPPRKVGAGRAQGRWTDPPKGAGRMARPSYTPTDLPVVRDYR